MISKLLELQASRMLTVLASAGNFSPAILRLLLRADGDIMTFVLAERPRSVAPM
jgi:hypothetical protein